MPHFLIALSYSRESKEALLANPTDRSKAAAAAAKAAGGKLIAAYATLGKHDVIAICELPDALTATAVSAMLGASGGFDGVETTTLLTMQELLSALKAAGKSTVNYKPPSR